MHPRVASVGSVNVDFTLVVGDAELGPLVDEYAWFPDTGTTVPVRTLPEGLLSRADRISPGGKGANQAVAAALAGAHTALHGMVGPDAGGFGVLESIAHHGVDVTAVGECHRETGKALVAVDPTGENRIAILEGANGFVDPAYIDRHLDAISSVDVVLLQNEIPQAGTLALLDALDGRDDRPLAILDPAPVEGVLPLVRHPVVDVVTPNASEYAALEDALASIDAVVIQTQGPDDVVIDGPDGEIHIEPQAVEVLDTTGAGDVFAGYLAREMAAGVPIAAAARIATVAASLSTTHDRGVQDSIPPYDEVTGHAS